MGGFVRVLYPPAVDEHGAATGNAPAFTGTGDGDDYTDDAGCNDWSDTAGSTVVGDSGFGGMRWSRHWYGSCGAAYRLYCFGVDRQAVVRTPPPPADAKLLFITTTNFDPSSGVAGADQLCNQEGQRARPASTFSALLATTAGPASSRFKADAPQAIYRPDGVRLATWHGQLFASEPKLDAAPTIDIQGGAENFTFAWTGAPSPVKPPTADLTCRDWTSRSEDKGLIGLAAANTIAILNAGHEPCSSSFRLFCLER